MLLNNDRPKNRLKHRGCLLLAALTGLLSALAMPAASAQAACSVTGQPCVRDDFDTRDYDLNTGTDDWATDWAEINEIPGGEGPTLGVILVPVTLDELRFQAVFSTDESNRSIARDVAIPLAASNATLKLRIGYSGTSGSSKFLQVTANSTILADISGSASPNPGDYTFDLDSVLGPVGGTTISIALTNLTGLDDIPVIDYWHIDFIEVTYDSPLAVTLADFRAEQAGSHMLVTWETASELDNQGFNLYRSTSDGAPETQLNDALIPSQAPGSAGGHLYTWEDRHDLASGTTYFYWLEDVSLSGATTLHGPVSVPFSGPTAVSVTSLHASSATGSSVFSAVALALAVLALLLGARAAIRRQHACTGWSGATDQLAQPIIAEVSP